jgi:hypothetical protein
LVRFATFRGRFRAVSCRFAAFRTIRERFAPQHVIHFGPVFDFGIMPVFNSEGGPRVDMTLRLNVLAVCAAFALVGAILLGAF